MEQKEQEFMQMVRANKSTIYTVCYMFSKDSDEVDDLFQEILVNLWQGYPRFEGRSNIKTWVYRVSLNVCITLDKKKKRKRAVESVLSGVSPFDDTDSNARQMEMLRKRLAKLCPFDRAIILLWLENMSYEEIGDVVGITAKNVSVMLFRIKEELKRMNSQDNEC